MSKEAERAELHKTIWRIANDLRGSVDGWDFKSYVLGMLFYRFISENLTAYLNEQEREAGNPDFDYAAPRRRRGRVRPRGDGRREGLLHPALASSSRTSASGARHDENLNETLATVFTQHRGLRGRHRQRGRHQGPVRRPRRQHRSKLGPTVAKRNEKLVKLLDAIGDLDLGDFADNTIDAFGDAYEYLMTDVRLERRQVRRRVLHAAGGLRAARPDHGRRQDRGEQGLRPGLRLRARCC